MVMPMISRRQKEHEEHRDWLRTLDFFQDEIKIFQNELAEVLRRHPNLLSVVEHVDEYRRILLKKLEHIDNLRCGIQAQERVLAGLSVHGSLPTHQRIKADYEDFTEQFDRFKQGFRRFVARQYAY